MLKTKRTYLIPMMGFAFAILIGSILLCLPACHYGTITYSDALFTATSGVTTTGFVKAPLYLQFTFLGQLVLAILMEIGALGFIIFISYFWSIKNKKMRMSDMILINDNISGDSFASIRQHSIFIIRVMTKVQITGIVLLCIKFIPLFGISKGIWYSIFHTISAFSNTGFDLFPNNLQMFKKDIYVQVVLIGLMISGSLGILVIENLLQNKFKNFSKLKLQTKIILIYTLILLIVPTILLFIWEPQVSLLNSLFMAATARSTGFTVINIREIGMASKIVWIMIMFIGGAPTSTSGGVKIVPIAIVLATVLSTLKGKEKTVIFWRQIPDSYVKKSFTIVFLFLTILTITTIIFSSYNNASVLNIIFDNVSAISNTGLSMVDMDQYNIVQENIFLFLMFMGRVGPLSLILIFINEDKKNKYIEYPSENLVL